MPPISIFGNSLKKLVIGYLLAVALLSPKVSWAQNSATDVKEANQTVLEVYRSGDINRALGLAEAALELSKRVLGSEHPDTLASINALAFFYQTTGRSGEAEPLFRRALEARERVHGPNHPYVNTRMVQSVLQQPRLQNNLSKEDHRGLTPLIYSHINPYGRFEVDLNKRIDFDRAVA